MLTARADRGRLQAAVDALAGCIDPDAPGFTRQALTPAEVATRPTVLRLFAEAGLETRTDGAGNVIGRLPGRTSAPPIVTGSHVDTVWGGGRFDGIVGVVGALEAVRVLREADVTLLRDLVVTAFYGEETNAFGLSCLGSRAVTGQLRPEHLAMTSANGARLADAFASVGIDPSAALDAAWRTPLAAYVELHIEQGPLLEEAQADIGLVERIVGIERFVATFEGRADHAGTTPMHVRQDACTAAAEALLALEDLAVTSDALLTPGRLTARPGYTNVVPYLAELVFEARSGDERFLGALPAQCQAVLSRIERTRRVRARLSRLPHDEVVAMDAHLIVHADRATRERGARAVRLLSGATHDAAFLSRLAPATMLFVPSLGGRSHCPEESSDLGAIALGVEVLAELIARIDGAAHAVGS